MSVKYGTDTVRADAAEAVQKQETLKAAEAVEKEGTVKAAQTVSLAEPAKVSGTLEIMEENRGGVRPVATRESYGNALVKFGAEYPELVVLEADLAPATRTGLFKKAFPERHIDCGIAECNMAGIAAGLATSGKLPFISSFAMFAAGRAFEQVRNSIGYPHLNVKIGATHAGITVGEDGASHQCNEDLSLMRAIPGMVVINPADDPEATAAVKAALDYVGPVYIRFGRSPVPIINDRPDYRFEMGKGVLLREGKDVTLIATGICVSAALQAAEMLETDGVSAEVINIHTVKPLDAALVTASAKKTGRVVTAEEHSIIGGLGSAVCEVLCEAAPTPVLRIGMQDCFGESGPASALVEKYGLDAKGIYEKTKSFLGEHGFRMQAEKPLKRKPLGSC